MEIKFLKRNIFQRIFGIPATSRPIDPDCWSYSDGKLTIALKKTPELEKPGGSIRLEGGNLSERILVVLGEDEKYHAFQNRCTHLGHRRLDHVPGTNTVQCCSMNKSTYDLDGKNIFGPAPKPITTFPIHTDEDKLVVTIL